MKGVALLTALLVVHVAAAPWWKSILRQNQLSDRPIFCRGFECPKYKILQQSEGFELREYDASIWVKTNIPEMEESYWEDHSFTSILKPYLKLFAYISGFNDQRRSLERTLPTLLVHEEDDVQMSYMLPHDAVDNPPRPLLHDLQVNSIPSQQLYVRAFGGNPYSYNWHHPRNQFKNETAELKRLLNEKGLEFDESVFYTAEYNTPWALGSHHNEVWIPKK